MSKDFIGPRKEQKKDQITIPFSVQKVENVEFSNSNYYNSQNNQPVVIQGTNGSQGPIGSQGTQGLTGSQGTQGLTGSQGTQGSTGSQGIQGLTGSQGTQG
jgi:hypothetical protein